MYISDSFILLREKSASILLPIIHTLEYFYTVSICNCVKHQEPTNWLYARCPITGCSCFSVWGGYRQPPMFVIPTSQHTSYAYSTKKSFYALSMLQGICHSVSACCSMNTMMLHAPSHWVPRDQLRDVLDVRNGVYSRWEMVCL